MLQIWSLFAFICQKPSEGENTFKLKAMFFKIQIFVLFAVMVGKKNLRGSMLEYVL